MHSQWMQKQQMLKNWELLFHQCGKYSATNESSQWFFMSYKTQSFMSYTATDLVVCLFIVLALWICSNHHLFCPHCRFCISMFFWELSLVTLVKYENFRNLFVLVFWIEKKIIIYFKNHFQFQPQPMETKLDSREFCQTSARCDLYWSAE